MPKRIIRVPVDEELLKALDIVSRRQGRTRAEVIREACHNYLRHLEEEALERAYVEGYRRIPERPQTGKMQVGLLDQVLVPEEW